MVPQVELQSDSRTLTPDTATRRIRLLTINNSADIYGASRSLLRIVLRLAQDGHEVHLIIPSDGPLVQLLDGSGITVHVLPALAVIERHRLKSFSGLLALTGEFLQSVVRLLHLTLHLRIDVIHSNTGVTPAPALTALLARRPHLWHVREFFSDYPRFWRFYQAYICALSSLVITNSYSTRDQFDLKYRSRCRVIYNGLAADASDVDGVLASELRERFGAPQILVGVVGRIKWHRKGQEILVQAASLLKVAFPNVRYAIVGSCAPGNEEHLLRLRTLIDENGLNDQVIIAGEIAEVREFYAACDITVVPSIAPEPFGCVALESMAVGTPVIASKCGGLPEQVIHDSTGLLVEPGNVIELATALARLFVDKNLRRKFGTEGREHVFRNFNHDSTYIQFTHSMNQYIVTQHAR